MERKPERQRKSYTRAAIFTHMLPRYPPPASLIEHTANHADTRKRLAQKLEEQTNSL